MEQGPFPEPVEGQNLKHRETQEGAPYRTVHI